jgi:undecaprenyl-diphosphatase
MSTRTSTTTLRTGIDALLRWDEDTLTAVSRFERRGMQAAMRALTRAGDTPGWIVHGLVLFTLLRVEAHALGVMATAAVIATLASQLAKRTFRRLRPTAAIAGFMARSADPDPFSFPSGHSTVAFAIATAAVATNPVLGGVETLLAASIAASRIYLGAHYPVDVLGGVALGFSCGLVAWGVLG